MLTAAVGPLGVGTVVGVELPPPLPDPVLLEEVPVAVGATTVPVAVVVLVLLLQAASRTNRLNKTMPNWAARFKEKLLQRFPDMPCFLLQNTRYEEKKTSLEENDLQFYVICMSSNNL